jgi:hypothetical protein
MESQVWTKSARQHPSPIGGSDARGVLEGHAWAPQRLWGEKRGEADPVDLSRKPRPSQSCDHARVKPSDGPVCAAHAEFVAALAGHPPRTIPLDADTIDLSRTALIT